MDEYIFLSTQLYKPYPVVGYLRIKEDIFILDLFDLGEEGVLFLRELLSSKGIVGH